ncbi:2TM domain-containing protein [Costertonia aggregata]|uniref:2TM domain-containing protein n=1 Tax=Costertonia aggregata TaxID=343403 RepID=A0A7H9AKY2_9FLAO|nr:2TM domain-containing protein [Costertonia aggregata]QLG44013.1 2TM domain-containing protein [Costertonia aggregata]
MGKNRFFKEIIKAVLVGTLIFFGFVIYYYFENGTTYKYIIGDMWREYYENMIFSVILYMVNAFWFFYLVRKYNYYIYTSRRMTIAVTGNIVVSCIGVFVSRFIILVGFYNRSIIQFLSNEKWSSYVQPMIIALGVSLIFYAIWYYRYRQENKVKEQKVIASTASAKFDALKNQLDPHFLFNSLNVLTSLIEEDPYQAQKFTTSLSKVYRYVLEQKNKDLVSVDEELQFARTYVRLLKMRFEDSIVFDIPDASKNPDAKIVPLSLQLLLENAVKHNIVTSKKPLQIKVEEIDDMLVISNNIQEKQVVKKSTGVGLQNIKQRYGILTNKEVLIEKTASHFNVFLPMLFKRVSVVETQESYIEDKRYEKAKERVEAIKGFYGNLTSYCIVIPILAYINYRTTSFPWAIFPALGWGFGLFGHGLQAFGYNPLFGRKWEEKTIKKYMEDENF